VADQTPEQRLAAFRDALARRPDDPFARYSVAMALRSAGDGQAAADEFREITRRSPDYVPSYLMLGQVLQGLGRPDEALAAFQAGMAAAQRRGDGHAERELRSAADAVRTQGNTP